MSRSRDKTLWISWTIARRSRELAPEFGARFCEFSWHKVRALRYPLAAARTLAALLWHRPRTVFVQNPSLVGAALAAALRTSRIFTFRLVVDAHTVVIAPRGWKGRLFGALTRFVERAADLTIVSNPALAKELERRGVRAAVLPDKIPELASGGCGEAAGSMANHRPTDTRSVVAGGEKGQRLVQNQGSTAARAVVAEGGGNCPADSGGEPSPLVSEASPSGFAATVVCISSFSPDEPLEELLAAARLIGPRVRILITGNPKWGGARLRHLELPPNVRLTGYLPEGAYADLLFSADAILVLTRMPNCLLCGAYEALAAGRPLILSDQEALRAYFGEEAPLYVENRAEAIAAGIEEAVRDGTELRERVEALRERLRGEWAGLREGVCEAIWPK